MNAEQKRNQAAYESLYTKIRRLPIKHLTHDELQSLDNPFLLDVRTTEEISHGTLCGAIAANSEPYIPEDRPIVVFCTVGLRSALYGIALNHGEVYNYSLMHHVWQNGTLVQPNGQPCTHLHTYSRRYASVMPPHLPHVNFSVFQSIIHTIRLIPSYLRPAFRTIKLYLSRGNIDTTS